MKKVKLTQVKSGIGRPLRQKRTLQALRLGKMNKTVEATLTPQIEGMIAKVSHLITIVEA
ncbi:MAG: 50S ribosomal protein L30 [Bacteroidales bacterium]